MKNVAIVGLTMYLCIFAATLILYGIGGPWEVLLILYPVAAYLIWRFVARRPLAEMGLGLLPGWRSQFIVALFVAVLLSVFWSLLLAGTGARSLSFAPASGWLLVLGPLVVGPLVAVVSTAVPEEFAYRGFLYHALLSWPGQGWAIVVSSLLFTVAHLQNLLGQGLPIGPHMMVKAITLFVFGLLMAWTVVKTGGIWFAIGWHAGTNYPGIVESPLFTAEEHGPAWLTGYPGGWPDTGLLGVVYAILEVIVVLWLLSVIAARARTLRHEAGWSRKPFS